MRLWCGFRDLVSVTCRHFEEHSCSLKQNQNSTTAPSLVVPCRSARFEIHSANFGDMQGIKAFLIPVFAGKKYQVIYSHL